MQISRLLPLAVAAASLACSDQPLPTGFREPQMRLPMTPAGELSAAANGSPLFTIPII